MAQRSNQMDGLSAQINGRLELGQKTDRDDDGMTLTVLGCGKYVASQFATFSALTDLTLSVIQAH